MPYTISTFFKVRELPWVKRGSPGPGRKFNSRVIYASQNSEVSATILASLQIWSLTAPQRTAIALMTLMAKATCIEYLPWAWRRADCTNLSSLSISHGARTRMPHFAEEETTGQSGSGHTLESGRAWTPAQVCLTAVEVCRRFP